MSTALTDMKCKPCEAGVPPISDAKAQTYLEQLDDAWAMTKNQKIKRTFKFSDFKKSMEFVNKIADVAEEEGHHPDIYIFYDQVEITLFTHAIDGLSENDFIVAAKIDEVVE